MRFRTWFCWIVLVAAALLLSSVGLRLVANPVGGVSAQGIVLPSPGAVTSMRAVGGTFVAVAAALLLSLRSRRTLVPGLTLLVTFAVGVTAARLLGLALDGPAPFTLHVLKPELALVILAITALVLASSGDRRPAAAKDEALWNRAAGPGGGEQEPS